MWKKALTPISVIVLLIGVGLIVYSTLGGDDSTGETTGSEVSAIAESVPAASIPGETAAPGASEAPSGTTVAPATPGDTPVTTVGSTGSSIFFPSFPSIVIPTSTIFFPSLPSLPSSSFVLPSLPGLTLAPGVIDALTCNSFKNCAQKLYDAWKAGTVATATNFATPAAIATLNGFPFMLAPGSWNANVSQLSPTTFVALSNRWLPPTQVRFNFVAGQSGYKVQSVQLS